MNGTYIDSSGTYMADIHSTYLFEKRGRFG